MNLSGTFKRVFVVPSLERDFSLLCASILIILCGFLGIIALETHQNQKSMELRDLQSASKLVADSLNGSLTTTSEFVQYIGNEVLNTYDGKPESALHLFKHDYSVDNKLNSFYAWTLLSWVNGSGNIVIAPTGMTHVHASNTYPLNKARSATWQLHVGLMSSREGYTYLPTAMGIESDDDMFVGTIITDILIEKLQKDIRQVLGSNSLKYHYIVRDDGNTIILDSNPQLHDPALYQSIDNPAATLPPENSNHNVVWQNVKWGEKNFNVGITYTSDGSRSTFWKSFLPHFYLAGTLTGIFLILIYTFRKRTILPAIQRLKTTLVEEIQVRKETDRFLEQILSGITGFVYRHKVDGERIVCEYISNGCLQLTGYSPARYFGKQRVKHSDVIHPDYRVKVITHIKDAIRHNRPFEISYPITTASGLTKWVLNQGHPIDHDLGLFEGLLTDITEMKSTEKKMEDALAALQLSNSELEEFAYACSHDLKEPLRTIFSFIQLYKRDNNPQYLMFIENSTMRMKYLIENILLYSQLGITAPVLEEVTPLNKIVDQVCHELSGAIRDSHAEIIVEKMGLVIGDRDQLYRLFQNLLSNALKFKSEHRPQISIGSERLVTGKWQVYVKDNGIGIPPEFHEKIFELFTRLHSQDQYQGSGIGLTLCKKIVERHGGKLEVRSVVGEGATFLFTLPEATCTEAPFSPNTI